MAIRSALARIPRLSRSAMMEGAARRSSRYFSDGKGKVFGEEEKAAENIYIKRMERERLEKLKLKTEKEKTEAAKAEKKSEEPHKG